MKIDIESSIEGLWLAPEGFGYLSHWLGRLAQDYGRMIPINPGLNVVYGRNGAGKTQLLQAIAYASRFQMSPYEGFVLRNPRMIEDPRGIRGEIFSGTPDEVLTLYRNTNVSETVLSDFEGFTPSRVTTDRLPMVLAIIEEFLSKKRCLLTRSVVASLVGPVGEPVQMTIPKDIQLAPMLLSNDEAPFTRAHLKAIMNSYSDLATEIQQMKDLADVKARDTRLSPPYKDVSDTTSKRLREWIEAWSWSPLMNRRNFGHLSDSPWTFDREYASQGFKDSESIPLFLPAVWSYDTLNPYGDFSYSLNSSFNLTLTKEQERIKVGDSSFSDINEDDLWSCIGDKEYTEDDVALRRESLVVVYVARLRDKLRFLPGFRTLDAVVMKDQPDEKTFAWLTMSEDVLVSQGSDAERRWLNLARASEKNTTEWVIIDEPESGLHRIAEAELAEVLGSPAWNAGSVIVVATHSPEFMDLPDAHVLHIDAGDVLELASMDREELSSLGLRPADLITRIRTVLLVEGEHELAVFETLFADELQRLRCKIIPTRGARNMKHVFDSQIIFYFSDAKIIGLMDNLNAQVITDLWAQAQEMARQGNITEAGEYLRSGLPGSKSSENLFLREFMSLALKRGEYERVEVWGLSKEDIVLYMEPSGFGLKHDWPELLKTHASSDLSFKPWLEKIYGADFSDDAIRRATQALDHIPEEFGALLVKLSELHQPRGVENESV